MSKPAEKRPMAAADQDGQGVRRLSVVLHGYEYSVYAWIAGFALHEKGGAYSRVEVNPFADIHLAPMMTYSASANDGLAMFRAHERLAA